MKQTPNNQINKPSAGLNSTGVCSVRRGGTYSRVLKMTKQELQSEAYSRAVGNGSTRNYTTIISGFVAKGISSDDIIPRENVFTFHAWKAQGRQVRRGEHGVKITTWIPMKNRKDTTEPKEKDKIRLRPKTAVVFHVSQTEPIVESEVA